MSKPFGGTINVDIRDSGPDWTPFEPPKAPDGAPNVLYIVLDDVGYSAMSGATGRAGAALSAGTGSSAPRRTSGTRTSSTTITRSTSRAPPRRATTSPRT
jgi:hypothetical protein